jgi:hypothetical protein
MMSRKFKTPMDEIHTVRTLMAAILMTKTTIKTCLQTIPINITETGNR